MPDEQIYRRCTAAQAVIFQENEGKLVDARTAWVRILTVMYEIKEDGTVYSAGIQHVRKNTEGEMATRECKDAVVALFLGEIANFVRYM